MQIVHFITWMITVTLWGKGLAAQLPAFSQAGSPPTSFPKAEQGRTQGPMSEGALLSHNFLTLDNANRFSYINPMSSEIEKNLYSQNIALVLFATASRGEFETLFAKNPIASPSSLAPYQPKPMYVPSSSTRWYVGDRLFAVDNSAFFGIEFDSSFAYRSGVVRIGDSSEKAVVILVSLYPSKK